MHSIPLYLLFIFNTIDGCSYSRLMQFSAHSRLPNWNVCCLQMFTLRKTTQEYRKKKKVWDVPWDFSSKLVDLQYFPLFASSQFVHCSLFQKVFTHLQLLPPYFYCLFLSFMHLLFITVVLQVSQFYVQHHSLPSHLRAVYMATISFQCVWWNSDTSKPHFI